MSSVLVRNMVQVVGKGKATLVLAHGFGTDQSVWRHQMDALAAHYRLVLFDHVGVTSTTAASYSPQRYRSLHSYAADLREIMATLALDQVVYVGHSMSAMIGLLAALEEPARFARMIFIGGSPRYVNEPGYHGGFNQSEVDALYAAMATNYQAWVSGFAGIVTEDPKRHEIGAEFARNLSMLRPDIALSITRMVMQSDHRLDLIRLTTPTLIIQNRHDVVVPVAVGQYMARHIKNAELTLLDEPGHLPQLSAPDAVNAAILSFLQ